jgi:hypothetical protein
MIVGRLDDEVLLDTLAWENSAEASHWLAGALDPDGRSLARRDAALLQLHRERFGQTLRCAAQCPGCGVALELELPVEQLIPASVPETDLRIRTQGFEVDYRLPTGEDIASVNDERALAERCVIAARVVADGSPISASALPAGALADMQDAMAVLHPAGGLCLQVTCAECGACWDADLDVAMFVAARAWVDAMRVVGEVHELAAAYGWTEAEVLAVPRARRRRYLDLVHQ